MASNVSSVLKSSQSLCVDGFLSSEYEDFDCGEFEIAASFGTVQVRKYDIGCGDVLLLPVGDSCGVLNSKAFGVQASFDTIIDSGELETLTSDELVFNVCGLTVKS